MSGGTRRVLPCGRGLLRRGAGSGLAKPAALSGLRVERSSPGQQTSQAQQLSRRAQLVG